MKFKKVGIGYANKNIKYNPNSKAPMFTGEVTINNQKLNIALWRNVNYGKESLNIQFTEKEED
jgi:hypothetical protein